jgi:hypothetical protein
MSEPRYHQYTEEEHRRMDAAEDAYLRMKIRENGPEMWPVWSQSSREQWLLDHGQEADYDDPEDVW